MIKPHCWGKMTWVLKYYPNIPGAYICNCDHGSAKCLELTRKVANKAIQLEENEKDPLRS